MIEPEYRDPLDEIERLQAEVEELQTFKSEIQKKVGHWFIEMNHPRAVSEMREYLKQWKKDKAERQEVEGE